MGSMLKGMENPYLFGDLHLFINVINGTMILHCEDSAVLRHCMAIYITMAYNFSNLFSTNGFFLIMPTILRCYSQRQTNFLLCQVIEFACQQLYLLHRKPFILQMFGSIANILDNNPNHFDFDPMKSLERPKDELEILSLVQAEKPLKALDLCYKDDPNTFCILTDGFASCVTICAYAPESRRSYQMLLIMCALLPHYLRHVHQETVKAKNSQSALKHELHIYTTLIVEIKALISCCDILGRHFSGPQRSFDIVNVSGRGKSIIADSPQFFDMQEESIVIRPEYNKKGGAPINPANWETLDDIELQREVFRKPRDSLLTLTASFLKAATPRLKEIGKALGDHSKIPDVLDHRSHVRLSEIALSLLKMAPYDPNTMSCNGLQQYFLSILPITDWSVEHNRSALNQILRRLDKTFTKIGKKGGIRRRANWDALSNWLMGLYDTLNTFPYMAHLHFLKTTVQMCLKIMIGDPSLLGGEDASLSSVHHGTPATVLSSSMPPQNFCSAVLKLTSFMMQALGEYAFSLEYICGQETLGPVADKTEAVLCQILMPMCLRAGTAKKDAPQLRKRDLQFCLHLILNAVNPPTTKSNLAPAPPSTTTSGGGLIPRGSEAMMGRTGSVSVAERSHSATVSTPKFVRDSLYQAAFLALKLVIVSFEKQLAGEWPRVAKMIKELALKRAGGGAMWSFLEFCLVSNTPLALIVRPMVQQKILTMKTQSDQEAQWHDVLRDKLSEGDSGTHKCNSSILQGLAQELKSMKEDFCTRPIDAQSRTPTIMGDLHSESGSLHSSGGGRRNSEVRRTSDGRRLSLSTASSKLSRLSPSGFGKTGVSPQESVQSPGLEECTIAEEGETEPQSTTQTPEQGIIRNMAENINININKT